MDMVLVIPPVIVQVTVFVTQAMAGVTAMASSRAMIALKTRRPQVCLPTLVHLPMEMEGLKL